MYAARREFLRPVHRSARVPLSNSICNSPVLTHNLGRDRSQWFQVLKDTLPLMYSTAASHLSKRIVSSFVFFPVHPLLLPNCQSHRNVGPAKTPRLGVSRGELRHDGPSPPHDPEMTRDHISHRKYLPSFGVVFRCYPVP